MLVAFLLALSAASVAGAIENSTHRAIFNIGVVWDGPIPEGDPPSQLMTRAAGLEMIRREILELTERDFDVRFPAEKHLAGDWTAEDINSALEQLLVDSEVHLILTQGVLATNEACRRKQLSKPVIAPHAIDIQAQGLPIDGNASGVENLNYLITPGSILRDLRTFMEVVSFETVHVLVDKRFLEAIPEVSEAVTAGGRQLELELVMLPIDRSAEEVLGALPEDAEAVYLTPPLLLPGRELDRLIAGLAERRLPSFSLMGETDVRRGVLAGVRRQTEMPRLARRIALNVQRILLGEDAGTLPVTLDQPGGLMINMATAAEIGVYPSFRVIREAEQIRPEAMERKVELSLTLSEAVERAVQSNLDLRAVRHRVAAGTEDVRLARSQLLPRIDASLTAVQIDEDRARGSFGSVAEKTFSGGATLSQVLLSDSAWAGYSIAGRLQESLELQEKIERLDIALDTSVAFLNTLRAESLERIERENLRLTQSNLELARRRESVGFSGPADVYRWESRLATDRKELGVAHARVHSSFIRLNQILHRPLEEMFEAETPRLDDSGITTGFNRLRTYVENMATFAVFREFGVREGLANSPELQAFDALILAQERQRLSSSRAYWWPEVVLVGELERAFSKSGTGTEPPAPGFPERSDRNDWSIALQARLPLYTGGARKALLAQDDHELLALRVERAALAERIELRVRAALFDLSSSYPAIELAHEAAEAAGKNLGLVVETYSRGLHSIIELLDAQNVARNAEEAAANAEYDFLLDLMEFQRATDNFDFFLSSAEREAWFRRLDEFYEQSDLAIHRSQR